MLTLAKLISSSEMSVLSLSSSDDVACFFFLLLRALVPALAGAPTLPYEIAKNDSNDRVKQTQ